MKEIDRKKQTACEAFISGASLKEVALVVGRSEVTVWRWMREPDMAPQIKEAGDMQLAATCAKLAIAASRAVDILSSVMDDESTASYVRVNAAKALVDASVKHNELYLMAGRMIALEQVADAREQGWGVSDGA